MRPGMKSGHGDMVSKPERRGVAAPRPSNLELEASKIGNLLARLRQAHPLRQQDAALRAGISRNTAYRIESGDASAAIGYILHYLEALAPGATFRDLFDERSSVLVALRRRETLKTTRVVVRVAQGIHDKQ